jgi:hypothetical protein
VKGNKDPAVCDAYLERYPKGEFSPTARALIAQYELQLAERAARKEETRHQAAASKAAEPRRLDEERAAHGGKLRHCSNFGSYLTVQEAWRARGFDAANPPPWRFAVAACDGGYRTPNGRRASIPGSCEMESRAQPD